MNGDVNTMNVVDVLRFGWKPNEVRLLVAALAAGGVPAARAAWVTRTGIPRNHLFAVIGEVERLGGAKAVAHVDGVAIFVQPMQFWRVTPLADESAWNAAWRGVVQQRLGLVTEMPSLAEAMAVSTDPDRARMRLESATEMPSDQRMSGAMAVADTAPVRPQFESPTVGGGTPESACPDSGKACPESGRNHPESGNLPGIRSFLPGFRASPFNVQRLTPVQEISETLNGERLTAATGIRTSAVDDRPPAYGRAGWVEPETEEEAMAACAALLGGREELMQWGGRWRNRWRENPSGMRKILNMVREDQANGRKPKPGSNWGRYASDLWTRFVDKAEVKR